MKRSLLDTINCHIMDKMLKEDDQFYISGQHINTFQTHNTAICPDCGSVIYNYHPNRIRCIECSAEDRRIRGLRNKEKFLNRKRELKDINNG